MYEITALCCENLPADKPRYLMGVGTPWNILECISLGIRYVRLRNANTQWPQRNAVHNVKGVINIKNKKWATDFSPC
jgi:queuine tRNA-ribosyltransferase